MVYSDLTPWKHFVPVRADLSDLAERVAWCQSHPDEARRIGEQGQRIALKHDMEHACRLGLAAIEASLIV